MISCRFFLSFFQRESAGAQRIFIDRERTDQQPGSQSRAWLWRATETVYHLRSKNHHESTFSDVAIIKKKKNEKVAVNMERY